MSTDPIAPPAMPPSDRSTVKWSFTYESSTGADFAKTQSEIGMTSLDSLLSKLVEVFVNTRTPPIVGRNFQSPPVPDNVLPFQAGAPPWGEEDETISDVLEGQDWLSSPLRRRVDHLRKTQNTAVAIEVLIGEFVTRFDGVYDNDYVPEGNIMGLILKFFSGYGITQEDPYVADLVAQILRMNYEERDAWMNQLLKDTFPGEGLRAAIRDGLHGLPTSSL
jgi:hypothetical protein